MNRGDIAFWAAILVAFLIAIGLVNLEQESQRSGERVDYYSPDRVAERDAYNRELSRIQEEWNRECWDVVTGQVRDLERCEQ